MPSPRRAPPIRSPIRENPGPDLKSIAYELARDHDEELETVVVPTSKADLLLGIGRGLRELAGAGLISRITAMVRRRGRHRRHLGIERE